MFFRATKLFLHITGTILENQWIFFSSLVFVSLNCIKEVLYKMEKKMKHLRHLFDVLCASTKQLKSKINDGLV